MAILGQSALSWLRYKLLLAVAHLNGELLPGQSENLWQTMFVAYSESSGLRINAQYNKPMICLFSCKTCL